MGSSPPHEPWRLPISSLSTYYPWPPPTMQPSSFVNGVTYAVDPPIRLARSTAPPSDPLSIQQSPPSALPQRPNLPPIHTPTETIRPPELRLSLCDGRSSHTANPPSGFPSSRPHDPNSATIQQNSSSVSSPWRQLPPLDFNRPPPTLKPIPFGDPGLHLPRFYPSNVSRPMVSNTNTSKNPMKMGDKEGHGRVGGISPGFRGMIVYEAGYALDPQQQMYENPLRASEDRGHPASTLQQMYGYPQPMARGNKYHPADLPQRMHGNPESIAGAHSGGPSIAQQQMQSNTQLMARENRGDPPSRKWRVRRLNPTPRQVGSMFECDQCLEWHVDLASHRKIHLEAKRFTCRNCKKRFTIDDLAASFSRPTEKTLINTFHRHVSQPTNATMGIEKTNRLLSNDNNTLCW